MNKYYQQGYKAYLAGEQIVENPQLGLHARNEWKQGWLAAQAISMLKENLRSAKPNKNINSNSELISEDGRTIRYCKYTYPS